MNFPRIPSAWIFPLFIAATISSLPANPPTAVVRHYEARNPIPPRLQWNENGGYCGEVCFISAGLYFGQYVSEYDARAALGLHVRQNTTEILLGWNDLPTAAHLRLAAVEWNPNGDPRTPRSFLAWVKRQVVLGRPVAVGVYDNEARFVGRDRASNGDETYDHIVSVVGVGSHHPLLGRRSYADDTLLFSDNGLWGLGPTRRYFFRVKFSEFPADRTQSNAPGGRIYSLPSGVPNYGIAFTGIVDPKHETVPVRLTTNINFESPQIIDHTNRRPPGRPVTLTITVSKIVPGRTYRLYRYDAWSKVPKSEFNRHANVAAQSWTIQISSGSTYRFKQTIDSNDIAIYRAVPAN
jgi:hypothetical protein